MRAKRVDGNHAEIKRALVKAGAVVIDTSPLPGFVDLVVGFNRRTALLEVKRPPGPRGGKSDRQLTPDQCRLHETWTGGPLVVVDSVDAALAVLAEMAGGVDIDAVHLRRESK